MDLASIPWVQGSLVTLALGIIFSGFWLVLKGLLVPRSTVDKLCEVLEARIAEKTAEAGEWRTAWATAEETKREFAAQLGDLIEIGRASEEMIRSLQPAPRGRSDVAS